MKILALDTATENCSAALFIGGQLTARERLLGRGHASCILTMVDEVLGEAGTSLKELTAIAFGRGPGAFTGVRLAASITQGLSYAAGLPVVPVSDLRAVAQRALLEEPQARRFLVCNDARMREVYWACFSRSADDLAEPAGTEHAGDPAQVVLPADWSSGPPVYGAGTGFLAYPQLQQAAARGLSMLSALYPRAAEIALLAAPEVRAGRLLDPEQALPVYLRDNVAQAPGNGH